MFTKYVRTGSATATARADRFKKVIDWEAVGATAVIVIVVGAIVF